MKIPSAFYSFKKGIERETYLLILAGIISFASGFLVLFAKNQFVESPQTPLLHEEILRFTNETRALTKIQLLKFKAFLNPENTIPRFHHFPRSELEIYEKFNNNCFYNGPAPRHEAFQKLLSFQKRLCRDQGIPNDIFRTRPLYTPAGQSYAYLAYKQKELHLKDAQTLKKWLKDHLDFFNILELKELHQQNPDLLSGWPLKVLFSLSWDELYQITLNQPFIIGTKIVLVQLNEAKSEYQIFDRHDWEDFWKDSIFHPEKLDPSNLSKQCFVLESQVCWRFDFNKSLLSHWNPLTVFIVLLITVSILFFLKLGQILWQRKREQEKLKFSLEMLTHELRTPLTNISLQAEDLRNCYEQLPAEIQLTSIRMLDQIAKIRRITEASQNYLSKELPTNYISPKFVRVESLFDFIKDCVEPYQAQIKLFLQESTSIHRNSSRSLLIDPYWTMICINNLIQNAINHGRPPIIVSVEESETSWSLTVEDQGTEVFNPTQKSCDSQGLGLGLKLIKKILPSLHGTLTIKYNPTRCHLQFSIAPSKILSAEISEIMNRNNTDLPHIQGFKNEPNTFS